MKILVTGSRGFVGRNLVSQLHNIRDGKARNYGIAGEELTIYEYDMDSDPAELDVYCRQADFVFNLAGVNRPQDASEFMKGNFGFASTLLDTLKKHGNTCPVMISSSTQATLDNPYGESKRAGSNCCSSTPGKRMQRYWCTASRMFSVNGAAPTITARWPLSATTSPMTSPSG